MISPVVGWTTGAQKCSGSGTSTSCGGGVSSELGIMYGELSFHTFAVTKFTASCVMNRGVLQGGMGTRVGSVLLLVCACIGSSCSSMISFSAAVSFFLCLLACLSLVSSYTTGELSSEWSRGDRLFCAVLTLAVVLLLGRGAA